MNRNSLAVSFVLLLVAGFIGWRSIQAWIGHSHGYPKTQTHINNIELALTKICSDTGRGDLRELADPTVYAKVCTRYEVQYGVSDQPRYDPTHAYAPPARQHYREDAPDEYLGGGDDINNWDRDQTFMRFYN